MADAGTSVFRSFVGWCGERFLAGNATGTFGMAGSGSNATSESFTYNDRGEVLTASGSGGSTAYGYNGDGQVTSVADAAGTTSYTYDDDRLSTLTDPASGTTATYSYNDNSQVTGISYGPGNDSQSFGYDSLHRLTSDTLQTSGGTTVASVSYGYDADSQITSQTTSGLAGASSNTYTYDEAGRVTSWDNGTATTQYGYDGDGNLTQDGSKTYTYDARDELTSDGTNTYTYTARGTPSSESTPTGSVAVTFDAYGDQATAASSSYTYDALGRLTSDVATATGTGYTFSYAGSTSTIASDGASTYTWDPSGTTLAGVGTAGGGPGVLAFTDSHGDALGQFKATGTAMAGSQAFDPWGNVTATTGSLTGKVGFQSAWTDPATGKDLMGARWYAPSEGDFTSADTVQVDPVPDPAAASPFAYAADNPLDGTDPTGHGVINICGQAASLALACGIGLGSQSTKQSKSASGLQPGLGVRVVTSEYGRSGPAQSASEIAYLLFLKVRAEDQAAKLRSARAQPQKPADASRPASTPVTRTAQSSSRPQGPKHSAGGGSSRPAAAAAKPPGHASGPAPPGPASPVVSPEQDEAQILAQVEAAIREMAAGKSLTSAAPDLGTGTETIPIDDQGPSVVSTPEAPDLGTGTETIPVGDQSAGLIDKAANDQTEEDTGGSGTVYRVLRPDENPDIGLFPTDPDSNTSLDVHVRFGSQPDVTSRYISTTTDLAVAEAWAARTGNRIAVIDLSMVQGEIIDLTTYENRAYYLLDWKGRGYAMRSSEMVIDGWVPPEAVTEVRGGS